MSKGKKEEKGISSFSTNLESKNLASGLILAFEWSSLFGCFFLLSASAFVAGISILPFTKIWAASSWRSFREPSFELHICAKVDKNILWWKLFSHVLHVQQKRHYCVKRQRIKWEYGVLINLAKCWSNLVTNSSEDPGFACSISIKALVTLCKIDPPGSSDIACIT